MKTNFYNKSKNSMCDGEVKQLVRIRNSQPWCDFYNNVSFR